MAHPEEWHSPSASVVDASSPRIAPVARRRTHPQEIENSRAVVFNLCGDSLRRVADFLIGPCDLSRSVVSPLAALRRVSKHFNLSLRARFPPALLARLKMRQRVSRVFADGRTCKTNIGTRLPFMKGHTGTLVERTQTWTGRRCSTVFSAQEVSAYALTHFPEARVLRAVNTHEQKMEWARQLERTVELRLQEVGGDYGERPSLEPPPLADLAPTEPAAVASDHEERVARFGPVDAAEFWQERTGHLLLLEGTLRPEEGPLLDRAVAAARRLRAFLQLHQAYDPPHCFAGGVVPDMDLPAALRKSQRRRLEREYAPTGRLWAFADYFRRHSSNPGATTEQLYRSLTEEFLDVAATPVPPWTTGATVAEWRARRACQEFFTHYPSGGPASLRLGQE